MSDDDISTFLSLGDYDNSGDNSDDDIHYKYVDNNVFDAKNRHPANLRDIPRDYRILPEHKADRSLILPTGRIASETHVPNIYRHLKFTHIYHTIGEDSYAAKTTDGGVVTWGKYMEKYTESSIRKLEDVKQICASSDSFVAVLKDGTVRAWGEGEYENFDDLAQDALRGRKVERVYSNENSFVAVLKGSGKVVGWTSLGGKYEGKAKLINPLNIYSSDDAFVAVLKGSGKVVAWGHPDYGGIIPRNVKKEIKKEIKMGNGVKQIHSISNAFAALLENDQMVTWGRNSDGINTRLKVKQICTNKGAFAALLENGKVMAWGSEYYGGVIPEKVQKDMMSDVVRIYSNDNDAFAAILGNGQVVSWGKDNTEEGIIPAQVKECINKHKIQKIFPYKQGFIALLHNSRLVGWGEGEVRTVNLNDLSVIDVIGNSIILSNWEIIPIAPYVSTLADDPNYKVYWRMVYNEIIKSAGEDDTEDEVLIDQNMRNIILSYLSGSSEEGSLAPEIARYDTDIDAYFEF